MTLPQNMQKVNIHMHFLDILSLPHVQLEKMQ